MVFSYVKIIFLILFICLLSVIWEKYGKSTYMYTDANLNLNLRICPKPNEIECPIIVEIPKNSKVLVLMEREKYYQKNGHISNWRKIEYEGSQGWVNEKYLHYLQ